MEVRCNKKCTGALFLLLLGDGPKGSGVLFVCRPPTQKRRWGVGFSLLPVLLFGIATLIGVIKESPCTRLCFECHGNIGDGTILLVKRST